MLFRSPPTGYPTLPPPTGYPTLSSPPHWLAASVCDLLLEFHFQVNFTDSGDEEEQKETLLPSTPLVPVLIQPVGARAISTPNGNSVKAAHYIITVCNCCNSLPFGTSCLLSLLWIDSLLLTLSSLHHHVFLYLLCSPSISVFVLTAVCSTIAATMGDLTFEVQDSLIPSLPSPIMAANTSRVTGLLTLYLS